MENRFPPPESRFPYIGIAVSSCRTGGDISAGILSYDSEQPVLENGYNPIRDIAKIMPFTTQSISKALYFAGNKEMLKVLYKRKVCKEDRFGIEPSRACDAKDVLSREKL